MLSGGVDLGSYHARNGTECGISLSDIMSIGLSRQRVNYDGFGYLVNKYLYGRGPVSTT